MASSPGDFYFINEKQNSCLKEYHTVQQFHLKNALILKEAASSVNDICWLLSIKIDRNKNMAL